jgi:hypothetical protein
MPDSEQEWFVAERARALLIVYLTRRDDLVLSECAKEKGLNYLVWIKNENESPSVRQFGVFLRASVKAHTLPQLNKILRPQMRSLLRGRNFPYPVCLLYFTMEDNQGYYTWMVEPVLTEDGKPRLQRHSDASCAQLDRAALDKIVSQVNRWYDAFFSTIVITA